MDFQAMKTQLKNARTGRTIFAVASVVLLAINGLLAVKLYTTSNQVVLIPTSISDGMVARGAVDKRYIEAVALDAVYALYNASPQTQEYGRNVIERTAAVSARSKLLELYDKSVKDLKGRDLSTVFYTRRIEHTKGGLEVVIEGDLRSYVSTALVSVEKRRILVTFKVEAGSARISKINRLEITE